MGGMDGFGPIDVTANDTVFASPWEGRVFALTLAMGRTGMWNVHEVRHARERMPPVEYLRAPYWERWVAALELLVVEKGVVAAEVLHPGEELLRDQQPSSLPHPVEVVQHEQPSGPRRHDPISARFHVGDQVSAINVHPAGHTRMPRYVRGHHGVVMRAHGVFPFADALGTGLPDRPQHVYNVRFASSDLWGPEGATGWYVHVDLWEDHLEPAGSP